MATLVLNVSLPESRILQTYLGTSQHHVPGVGSWTGPDILRLRSCPSQSVRGCKRFSFESCTNALYAEQSGPRTLQTATITLAFVSATALLDHPHMDVGSSRKNERRSGAVCDQGQDDVGDWILRSNAAFARYTAVG